MLAEVNIFLENNNYIFGKKNESFAMPIRQLQ